MHHVIPQLAVFVVGDGSKAASLKALERELENCVPLCARCHWLVHHWEGYLSREQLARGVKVVWIEYLRDQWGTRGENR
jgi:hypothetical protein